jgi:DNA-binding NarL/FixJ family response regulator
MRPPIAVLLVDDHALVRKGFRRILEDDPAIRVVGEAGNGREAIDAAQRLRPQVVVMDLAMPGLDGVGATREILARLPGSAVLVLSMYADDAYVRNALDAGAKGYLLKNAIDVDLPAAVKAVAAGRQFISPGVRASAREPAVSDDHLTPREKQILQLIAQGKSNKEIATLLDLSVNTVAVHRSNLMQALNLHRTADLVVYAIKNGLVALP